MIDELVNTQVVGNYDKYIFGDINREAQQLQAQGGAAAVGGQALQAVYLDGIRRVAWDRPQFFTTHFDEKGELTSKDPNMLTYLTYYHFASGDIETALHYFEKLETYGKQYPFTEEALTYIDRLILLLGYSKEELGTELALRLAAIREKNVLIQMPTDVEQPVEEEGAPPRMKHDRLEILRSLVLQEKFCHYLESIKVGGRKYLTGEDELFIFKTLIRASKDLYKAQTEGVLTEEQQGYLRILGTDYVAQVLMSPTLVRRLHYLRAKHNEEEIWQSRRDRFLLEAVWYERTNPYTRFLGEPKRRGVLGQTNALAKEVLGSPLVRPHDIDYAEEMVTPTCSLEEVPVAFVEMDPRLLVTNFLHYYRLASGELPRDWIGNEEKQALFEAKREAFLKNYPLMRGNFSPKNFLFYDLLDRVATGSRSMVLESFLGKYPSADEIRVELLAVQGGTAALEARIAELEALPAQIGWITYREECMLERKRPSAFMSPNQMVPYNLHGRERAYVRQALEEGRGARYDAVVVAHQELEAYRMTYQEGLEDLRNEHRLAVDPMQIEDLERRIQQHEEAGLRRFQELEGRLKARTEACHAHFNEMMQKFVNQARADEGLRAVGSVVTIGNALGATRKTVSFGARLFTTPVKVGLRQLVMPLSAGLKERMEEALYSASPIPFTRQLVRGFSRVFRQEMEVMREAEGPVREPEKVSEELATVLNQREERITTALRELLEEYCVVTTTLNDPKEPIPEFNFEGLDDEAVAAGFQRFNAELQQFYARNPGETITFALREGRSAEEFIHAMKVLQEEVEGVLRQEREAIMKFVNQEKLEETDEEVRTLRRLEKVKAKHKPIQFYDMMKWFLTEDDAILLNRSETSPEHLPIIREKLYLYLLTASRFNLIFDKIGGANPERGIDALAAELLHERSYSIVAGDFARLLKAKLAYEAHKGVLLWEVQSTHLDRIVRERGTHVLNVMIMGDGKTTGVIPAEDYAEADGKERLVVNVWPKSVKGQCLDHMEANPYSQGVNAFIIDRKRNWDSERLWALVKVFRSALQHREQLNVTQEDLQSLLLRFIDEAVDIEERYRADSAEYKKRMGYYQQLILTIMDHITLNVDEIHEAAREDKELNFPLGKRRTLKVEDARALEEVILQLLTIPEIEQYITIKDAEPKVLPANVFEEHVAPVVAAKLVALSQLEIPVEHRDAIAAYLCGRSEEIPLCAVKHPQYKTLCMMRGALMVIIPKTLEELPHKHFNKASADNKVGGEERDIDVQYGKPSEGNMGTVEEADFLLPFKTFVASCVLFAKDRLNDEQVIRMIRYLQSNAEKEAKERGIHQDNTDVARQFREVLCPGVELFSIGEEVDAEVIEQLRQSDVVTLAYVREFVRPAIKYYPKLLESNGQDIMNLAKVLRMHTGTPEEELLPEETKAVAREGILGQSLHTFEARTKEVRVFSRSAPEEVLETDVIQGFFNLSRMHQAITDRGATLNGLTPEEVARKVWVGIRDVRTDVKGVVFFQKDRPMILTAAGVLALADSRVTPEEYVVIFDEIHTYAANVPLKDGAVILHTVGETTTFEKETDQAQYRARGIEKRGQKQIIAMTPHVRSRIIDEERIPTIRECGRFLGANGFKARSKRTFFIKCRKVESQVKHAIIEKAVRARSVEQMIAIFRAFTDVLVTDVSDNPVDLYGFLRVSVDSNVALRAMRDRLIAQLVTKQIGGTPVFSPEDLRELNASLTEVIEGRRFKLAEELYKVVQSRVIAKIEHAADRGPVATRYAAFLQLGVRAYLASFFDSEEGREENPLAILKNRVLQQVQTHYFTVEEVAEIEAQLNAIVAQDRAQAAQQVQAYSRTEGLSTDAITAMGRVVQVQVQNEAEEEEQQEQIEEVNNLQQAGLEDEHPVPPDEDIRWSSTIDPTNLDQWFHLMNPRDGFSRMGRYRGYTPPLFQLSEGLKLAESEAIRAFAETLSPAICCSWNMFKVFSSSVRGRVLEPFGDRQKPIFEALLVQNGAQQKIILVDQEEAEFWRGKLKEDREHLEGASVFGSRHLGQTLFRPSTDKAIDPNVKIALIDVHTGIIAATGANAVTEDDVNTYVMKRARAQCKLMAGYTNYTEAELEVVERWATHRGADRIINFFEPVAYAHHPKEKYDRSNLQELFFRLQDRVREPDLVRV
ncbi:MAG: DUF3638 domain-containing protein [Chlamydiia bacterium]|nr:DUF3638 domain-containing protein [Chlamydiia bacterium]